jgi:hypothetical protein
VRKRERMSTSFVVACIVCIHVKTFYLFYKTGLLACSTCAQAVWYMPMHKEEVIACVIVLCMKIFVCFIKQASLQTIISIFSGGVDNCVLWLSFTQQKRKVLCNTVSKLKTCKLVLPIRIRGTVKSE